MLARWRWRRCALSSRCCFIVCGAEPTRPALQATSSLRSAALAGAVVAAHHCLELPPAFLASPCFLCLQSILEQEAKHSGFRSEVLKSQELQVLVY